MVTFTHSNDKGIDRSILKDKSDFKKKTRLT